MTKPYRIRSPETWAQARADYAAGLGADAVCRRHDLGVSNFRRRARLEGWRRADQADPAPRDEDPALYDNVGLDGQIDLARQRYLHALARGRAVEAVRWRRLWRELQFELDKLDGGLFVGWTPDQIEAFRIRRALGPDDAASGPENVHDVHPIFSGADTSDESSEL